ncbi:DUF6415 family natural product biosynthesis protein [Streptomyces cucumeris]|uniref:DUF6415 family natural product biosynthesis protein n=1 Tax=Streptomyces cucumeris TaxID=2962890 RepID=UPI003EC0F8C4
MGEALQHASERQDDVDIDGVKAAIDRALVMRTGLPPYSELVELHQTLRWHIRTLLPLAEARVERMDRGTVDWYDRRCRLNTIPHKVARGLGSGLQSADDHVRSLGYSCKFLLENSGLTPESDQ